MKKFQTALLACTMIFGTASIPAFAQTPEVALPAATAVVLDVEDIKENDTSAPDLTFAMNFIADEPTPEQVKAYGNWYADFKLTVNKEVTFNANSDIADGYLAGQYDNSANADYPEGTTPVSGWLQVPVDDVTLNADKSIQIMKYASENISSGLRYTYGQCYSFVQDFDCGVYFSDEFIAANPDLEVTLELCITNPEDESVCYTIGEPYTFKVWESDTDAGYYTDGDNTYGMIRYLFGTAVKGEITDYGIKYIKGADITDIKDSTVTASGKGKVNAFYGDLIGIKENTSDTYYAIAYVTDVNGTTYWSKVVECTPNWTRDYTDYVGGAN